MKKAGVEIGFAVMAWLVPFAVSVCVFPLRQAQRPLFEVIMSFTLTANTAVLGLVYLRRVEQHRLVRAIAVGLTSSRSSFFASAVGNRNTTRSRSTS